MKLFKLFISTLSLVFMSNSFAGEINELNKFSSLKYMSFMNTLVTEKDYVSENKLKDFESYDFTVESSPCTVLGDYYSETDDSNTIYTIKIDEQDFRFMCRQVLGMKDNHRRLYLLGSTYECLTRPFDYSNSDIDDFKYLASLCKKDIRENKNIDYAYLELFHSEKYYQVLANLVN